MIVTDEAVDPTLAALGAATEGNCTWSKELDGTFSVDGPRERLERYAAVIGDEFPLPINSLRITPPVEHTIDSMSLPPLARGLIASQLVVDGTVASDPAFQQALARANPRLTEAREDAGQANLRALLLAAVKAT